MAGQTDKYSNVLTEEIVMSAADTLTFEEVNVGLSLFDKAGILINRVEYQPAQGTTALMTAQGDIIQIGVTSSNSLTSLATNQAAVIHVVSLARQDFGTAAGGQLHIMPIVFDFAGLPGGGLLITPKPWYIAMKSVGLASAGTGYVRFYFTVIKLSAENYFELL